MSEDPIQSTGQRPEAGGSGSGTYRPDPDLPGDLERRSRRRDRRRTLRDKAPELALEVVSVVLAVLLALFVDEWREEAQRRELAERARESIVGEIRGNLQQLEDSGRDHDLLLAYLQTRAAELERDSTGTVSIDFAYSLLSGAAWQTAQLTQAVHYMEYDWVTRVSRLYDLQELYGDNQAGIMNVLASFGTSASGERPRRAIDAFLGRFGIFLEIHAALEEAYRNVLRDSSVETTEQDRAEDPDVGAVDAPGPS